jgi:callose synthase
LSWVVILLALVVLKVSVWPFIFEQYFGCLKVLHLDALTFLQLVSIGRQKFGTDLQLLLRILKTSLFLLFAVGIAVLVIVYHLTVGDFFA